MRVLHFSDSHGQVPSVLKGVLYDAVVCSGDFLPDRYVRVEDQRRGRLPPVLPGPPSWQEAWVKAQLRRGTIQALVGSRPFLFCPGNHDFYDLVPLLRSEGVDAHCLREKVVVVGGIKFYGFPWCPWAGGVYNYEVKPPAMNSKVGDLMVRLEAGDVDVLVAHCPPYGILSRSERGQDYGNVAMTKAFELTPRLPRAYLCGHIHASHGVLRVREMLVSNAATTTRLVDIE